MLINHVIDLPDSFELKLIYNRLPYKSDCFMTFDADKHVPVLVYQVLHWLINDKNGIYFDGTMGDGGHTRAVARMLNENGLVIASDCDNRAVKHAESWIRPLDAPVKTYHNNFRDFKKIIDQAGVRQVNGILLDLGFSSRQVDDPDRGFSYRFNGPLDMRMDERLDLDAFKIINNSSEEELRGIFFRYGEEKYSSSLARIIAEARLRKQISTTDELVVLMKKRWRPRHFVKSASRIFQALRIAVNSELDNLKYFLEQSWDYLVPGGRVVIISYHSLEDRLVKQEFRRLENPCTCPADFPVCQCGLKPEAKILTRRAIRPTEEEIERNPRARSAKLRAAEKTEH